MYSIVSKEASFADSVGDSTIHAASEALKAPDCFYGSVSAHNQVHYQPHLNE